MKTDVIRTNTYKTTEYTGSEQVFTAISVQSSTFFFRFTLFFATCRCLTIGFGEVSLGTENSKSGCRSRRQESCIASQVWAGVVCVANTGDQPYIDCHAKSV